MSLKRQRHLVEPLSFTIPALVRKQMPDHPETQYCLEIQVTLTKDGEIAPPPSHAWQAPVVEDMLWHGKSGLTEVVVTGPGWAILFYKRWRLGEGLSLGKMQDAMFTLSRAISWVGKQAQLSANPVSLGEGWQLIAQAITEWCIEPRGPGHPCSILPASSPFSFYNQGNSPWGVRLPTAAEWLEVPRHNHWASYHDWGWVLQCCQEHSHRQGDLWAVPARSLLPSPDQHQFTHHILAPNRLLRLTFTLRPEEVLMEVTSQKLACVKYCMLFCYIWS